MSNVIPFPVRHITSFQDASQVLEPVRVAPEQLNLAAMDPAPAPIETCGDYFPLPLDPKAFEDIEHNSVAPMATLDEMTVRARLQGILGELDRDADVRHTAEEIVRFTGSNTHHAKLGYGQSKLNFHLRMAATIFVMNGTKYPLRLFTRMREILSDMQMTA